MADALVGVRGSGEHALDADLVAEVDHVQRFGVVVGVEPVERFIPGGQQFPGVRVEVVAGLTVRVALPLGQVGAPRWLCLDVNGGGSASAYVVRRRGWSLSSRGGSARDHLVRLSRCVWSVWSGVRPASAVA
ncbi:hypothetical protein GCM10027187_51920 [Streptosporangium sandarakinum]